MTVEPQFLIHSKRLAISSPIFSSLLGFLIKIAIVCMVPFNSLSMPTIERNKPAVIALNDWASQRVLSHVVGYLFVELEIPHKFQKLQVSDQWGAFRLGLVDVQVELWQGTSFEQYSKHLKNGYIIDAGNHSVNAREEWWYPDYVKPLCPGLPKWKALLDCSHIFAQKDSNGKGIYYSGHWNANEGTRIRALGLNFTIERLPNDKALWLKLQQAISNKKPIILLNWEPNWTNNRISGEFVDFPSYNDKCITKAKWGLNKRLTNDCGNPKSGWVKKIGSKTFQSHYPCGFEALRRVNFTTEMMSEAAALVINDKLDEIKAAEKWIEIYKPQWLSWIPNECLED